MIALEVAKHVNPLAVVLIASCRTPLSVNQAILGCAPIARLMPEWMIRLSGRFGPPAVRNVIGAASRLLRWGPRAIARWPGVDQIAAPVFHIHGGCDRIIPVRQVRADRILRTGGHLINLTHAEQVNRFIEDVFHATEADDITRALPPTALLLVHLPSQT